MPKRHAIWLLLAIMLGLPSPGLSAAEAPKRYSAEVVAKAEKVLADAGLRRSGQGIVATDLAQVTRAIAALSKPRRALAAAIQQQRRSEQLVAQVEAEIQATDLQTNELNIRLAQPNIDVRTNNRLVAMINTSRTKLGQLKDRQQMLQDQVGKDRRAVLEAKTEYADAIRAVRQDFNELQAAMEQSIDDPQVSIACKVFAAEYDTPAEIDIGYLLAATDRKLREWEKEITEEAITLQVNPQGSLTLDVTIGQQRIEMVLDSGASMIILPARLAEQVGVEVPADAGRVRLMLADGSEIPARRVMLEHVRVGPFEAQQVAAAVVQADRNAAPALLGMSFLENFKFEIDKANRTLKLLEVNQP